MPTIEAILAQLKSLKAAGLKPEAAAASAVQALTPAPSANVLSQAMAIVFTGITATELAIIIHIQFPNLSALEVAQAVLVGLPTTGSATMYTALTGAGFVAIDAHGAVNLLFPVKLTIQSTEAWQATGLFVTGTQSTSISCAGTWTSDPAIGWCGPDGNSDWVAPALYTLPGAFAGAMVGQVGTNPPFLVGVSESAPTGQSGVLSLCINDDLKGVYGAGLTDNSGTMQVVISTLAGGSTKS